MKRLPILERLSSGSVQAELPWAASLSAIYSLNDGSQASRRFNETLQACIDAQNSPPLIESDGDEGGEL